jgi:hypothetical protein
MKKKDDMRFEDATYNKIRVEGLAGNPLAEAIPLRKSLEDFDDEIACEVEIPIDIDEFSVEDKEQQAMKIMSSVSPTSLYYDMYCDLLNVLKMSYEVRNPLSDSWKKHQNIVAAGKAKKKVTKTTGGAISFFGLSGTGKSTLVDSVLNLLPDVLIHKNSGPLGYDFNQIIYIKCDISGTDDPKEICLKILAHIDEVTGEGLSIEYRKPGHKVTDCIDRLITTCSTQNIGMLIFDEVQNIGLTKPNGRKQIFSLLHRLNNEAKVPVVSIGTNKALKLFQDEFTNLRRLGLSNDLTNYKLNDPDWQVLVEYAWSYQLVGEPLDLTLERMKLIYSLTAGVPYCLFFLMEQANIKAIRSGKNDIDDKLLKEVYQLKFKFMRPALIALRLGKTAAYDDIYCAIKDADKDHSAFVKELLKISHQHKLKGEAAQAIMEQIEPYLLEYSATKTEEETLKRLTKNLDLIPSDIQSAGNELVLPI